MMMKEPAKPIIDKAWCLEVVESRKGIVVIASTRMSV